MVYNVLGQPNIYISHVQLLKHVFMEVFNALVFIQKRKSDDDRRAIRTYTVLHLNIASQEGAASGFCRDTGTPLN